MTFTLVIPGIQDAGGTYRDEAHVRAELDDLAEQATQAYVGYQQQEVH